MALVRNLARDQRANSRPHPTEVDCLWQVVTGPEDATLLQLSTYGSDNRESEPKVSQTLQLDRVVAVQLVALLCETFEI